MIKAFFAKLWELIIAPYGRCHHCSSPLYNDDELFGYGIPHCYCWEDK